MEQQGTLGSHSQKDSKQEKPERERINQRDRHREPLPREAQGQR